MFKHQKLKDHSCRVLRIPKINEFLSNIFVFGSLFVFLMAFTSMIRAQQAGSPSLDHTGYPRPEVYVGTSYGKAQSQPVPVPALNPALTADPGPADIMVFQGNVNTISAAENQVRARFPNCAALYSSDFQAGKFFVLAPKNDLIPISAFLQSLQLVPINQVMAEQYDSRIAGGTIIPVSGKDPSMRSALPTVVDTNPIQRIYVPNRRKIQEIEAILVPLFGPRLQKIPSPNNPNGSANTNHFWRFTKRIRTGEPAAYCNFDLNAATGRITIQGDPRLCVQLDQLLRFIDSDSPVSGNVRRYIPLRQTDPLKIQEILTRSFSGNPVSLPFGRNENSSAIQQAAYRSGEKGMPIVRGNSVPSANMVDPSILPVNYQTEGGTGSGLENFSMNSADPNNRGVGVVPNYIPQVLPDLDVVIIDAPENEYRRIENMIREIEDLAKLAEPKIEIYQLKHVNCVMLQGILQQLHREMFISKQGRVLLYAMQNPNALLLVGWGQAFTAMKDLINVFDQPIAAGGNMMQVIRLQYASAREISVQLQTFFPLATPGTGGMAPRIRIFPDIRTNSLIIHASPNDFQEIQRLLKDLDVNKAAPRLRVQTFKLKNLLAQDLRQTLMNAILPSVQGTQDNASAKFPILEFLSVDAQSRRLIESGIMTDVNIAADVHNNQLIITAPEDCMDLLAKLVEMLDIAPARAQIKIFRIINGDATQLSQTLRSLLPTGGTALPTLPSAEGEESFVPLRLAIDTRTNCIIAAAAPKDLKIIEALIISLDRKDTQERKEIVVPLRNVQALAIAKAIDDYLSRKQKLEISSEATSVYQMFESQVIVIPESITNSLIISATPKYLEEIRQLVESFDTDPPQVVIQVLIAEVTLGNREEFGVEAGLQDKVAFDRSLITQINSSSATGIPGYNFIETNSNGTNMYAPDSETVAGQVLNTLGMGRTSSAVDFGGLVLSASSRSVEVTLRALQQKNRLRILSRPQITAMDNQQAFILVGKRVPRVQSANMTNYGVSSSVADANVGLILLVTPRVSKEGRVIMEIGAEKSSIAGDNEAIPVFSSDGEVIKSPSINTIQAMTAVSAQDGETVMLGGLITSSKEKIRKGIPWLCDIPHVGWLFRFDQESEERKELLIVMTPRIVRNSEDIEEIKRVEASKMNWCLTDAMALNGNMGLFDALTGVCPDPGQMKHFHYHKMDKMDELKRAGGYCPGNDYPVKSDDMQETYEIMDDSGQSVSEPVPIDHNHDPFRKTPPLRMPSSAESFPVEEIPDSVKKKKEKVPEIGKEKGKGTGKEKDIKKEKISTDQSSMKPDMQKKTADRRIDPEMLARNGYPSFEMSTAASSSGEIRSVNYEEEKKK
ncbi:MAG: secretin N-terminal domain-containing protein [Planctomycetia bacterium]|nr:secretin N-terminal domain-containing protein [Planctomycetia bacterium]